MSWKLLQEMIEHEDSDTFDANGDAEEVVNLTLDVAIRQAYALHRASLALERIADALERMAPPPTPAP